MLLLTIKLICLDSVQVNENSTIIYFNQGQSLQIESTIKNYTYATTLVQRSLQRQHPIAVTMVNNEKVSEVLRADNDYISDISNAVENKIEIHFQGHDGKYYLDTNNTNYQTLLKKINNSISNKERVWFITAPPGLTIYDLLLESELKKIKKKKWW